ncbi:MAG TPA: VOC family protein [Acidimicrobiales bacterium]|nr:VOC family protein [Acidimicrobiales bacterium]
MVTGVFITRRKGSPVASGTSRITHLALPVTDLKRSTEFYQRWASLEIEPGLSHPVEDGSMVRLTDKSGSFALMLVKSRDVVPLAGTGHIGVSLDSDEQVTTVAEAAASEGFRTLDSEARPGPLGLSAFISDPDGHQVEFYHG